MGWAWGHLASWVTCVFLSMGLLLPAEAWALPVNLDCYLSGGPVECGNLDNAFFESIPGAERSNTTSADLGLEIRSTSLAAGRRYSVAFRGKNAEDPHFTLAEDVPSALGSDQALNRILALLHRGTMPFLLVNAPGRSEDGLFLLEASTEGSEEDSAGEDSAWYFRPSLSAELVHGGLTIVAARANLELNRSDADHRLLVNAQGSYRYVDFELPDDQRLRGGFAAASGSLTFARSLGAGFSVAALTTAQRSPQNNLGLRLEAGAGLEWLKSTFLESDEGNVGFRYRLMAVFDDYVSPSVLQATRLNYARHGGNLFAKLHLEQFDLGLDLSAGAPVHRPDFWSVGGEASVVLRVASGLELGVNAYLRYQGGAIHEPFDADALDPVATLLSGNDFARTNYGAELSIAYTLGNGLLKAQDQRWR